MSRHDPQVPDWIVRIIDEARRGRPIALLFDYDGTLTPIVRHPSLARLPSQTRRILTRLAEQPNLRLGVISGRSLHEVRNLIGLDRVYLSGSGGLEMDLLGRQERDPGIDIIGDRLDLIQDGVLDILKKYPGTWIERKPGALAIHFRGLSSMAAAGFRYETTELLTAEETVRFRVVSEAIEVSPVNGWDKGTAVTSIALHMEVEFGTLPFIAYCGDSPNDLEGMNVAIRSGGIAIGVGLDAPVRATVSLTDPTELRECLALLAERLQDSSGNVAESACNHESAPDRPGTVKLRTVRLDSGLLIIDPDEFFRRKLAQDLSQLGWQVWQAETAEMAAEILVEHAGDIHVALVDLYLPGLEGARTLAWMGRKYPHLIRGYLSSDISSHAADAFKRLSDLPLFVKPVRADQLDSVFRTRIRQHSRRQCDELSIGS